MTLTTESRSEPLDFNDDHLYRPTTTRPSAWQLDGVGGGPPYPSRDTV
jgi:hypothetical protein